MQLIVFHALINNHINTDLYLNQILLFLHFEN